ncbi:MAG: prepilin-type N-terminal cleavage/methylation domain-containing protein [Lactobacillales bacterium]|nr:prepilin-type N-terminal cleavage/methylation domain-containing protein [Lactobacillales bacterium]
MKKKNRGFTLLEMLFVIFVIAVLMLLFVPNLMEHKDYATKKSDEALVKVVDEQFELYMLNHDITDKPDLKTLVDENYITKQQSEKYTAVEAKVHENEKQ